MTINKLKSGMTVYDVRKATGFRRLGESKWAYWTVRIIRVDAENRRVLASWNNNRIEWFNEHTWSKWRLKLPEG